MLLPAPLLLDIQLFVRYSVELHHPATVDTVIAATSAAVSTLPVTVLIQMRCFDPTNRTWSDPLVYVVTAIYIYVLSI